MEARGICIIVLAITILPEVLCEHKSCSGFECAPGQCIPYSWQCDTIIDCFDTRDEVNCDEEDICEGFQCASGGCAEPHFVCDEFVDCNDGSDEFNCDGAATSPSTTTSTTPSTTTSTTTSTTISTTTITQSSAASSTSTTESTTLSTTTPSEPPCKGFQCPGGKCLAYGWQCDGIVDCDDEADELNCDQDDICEGFQCASGGCTAPRFVCDEIVDCNDGSDEFNCDGAATSQPTTASTTPSTTTSSTTTTSTTPSTTTSTTTLTTASTTITQSSATSRTSTTESTTFSTTTDPSVCEDDEINCFNTTTCIPKHYRCDKIRDCDDGWDESDCDPTCKGFQCPGGKCLAYDWQCDGIVDCDDEADELNCDPPCKGFQCPGGKCLTYGWQCDGIVDCDDEADELNCEAGVCVGYQCLSGRCTSPNYLCDDIRDCGDGTDEQFCYDDFRVISSRRPPPDIIDLKHIVGNQPIQRDIDSDYFSDYVYIQNKPLPEGDLTHIVFYTVYGKIEVKDVKLHLWERRDETHFKLIWEKTVSVVIVAEGKAVTVSLVPQAQITLSNNTYLGFTYVGESGVISYDILYENDAGITDVWKQRLDDVQVGEEYEIDIHQTRNEIYSIGVNVTAECLGFKCHWSDGCIPTSQVCDRERDCEDLSDELFCGYCVEPDYYRCETGHCISADFVCDIDRVKNCPNGEDELFCECGSKNLLCNNTGICIHETALCNRVDDCDDGEDEEHCADECPEHTCYDYNGCYTKDQLCDGTVDCDDGTDEKFCERLSEGVNDLPSNLHMARSSGLDWIPVCYDTFVMEVNDILFDSTTVLDHRCNDLGYRSEDATISPYRQDDLPDGFEQYLVINWDKIQDIPPEELSERGLSSQYYFDTVDSCPDGNVMLLDCRGKRAECGRRKQPIPFNSLYIVNGRDAKQGSWPWQAALYDATRDFFCGGVLIAENWVLTAAHCLGSAWFDVTNLSVMVGSINRKRGGTRYKATQTFMYPEADITNGYKDLALIKLETPVELNDDVNIICLPGDLEPLGPTERECFISGWGRLSNGAVIAPFLQQARMPILPVEDCNAHVHQVLRNNSELYDDTYNFFEDLDDYGYSWEFLIDTYVRPIDETWEICAGYLNGLSATCYGDSGGPLACRNDANTWVLQSVVSWGPFCQSWAGFPRLTAFMDWIMDTTNHLS